MISYKTAKELRDAGLKWEPRLGDMFYDTSKNTWDIFSLIDVVTRKAYDETLAYIEEKKCVFAPSLAQLLTELDKRQYIYEIDNKENWSHYCIIVNKKFTQKHKKRHSYVLEEAVANVLLWILKEELEEKYEGY